MQCIAARTIQSAWRRALSYRQTCTISVNVCQDTSLSRAEGHTAHADSCHFHFLPSVGTWLASPSRLCAPDDARHVIEVEPYVHSDRSSDGSISDNPLLGMPFLSMRDARTLRTASLWHGGWFDTLLRASIEEEFDEDLDEED